MGKHMALRDLNKGQIVIWVSASPKCQVFWGVSGRQWLILTRDGQPVDW